MQLFSYGFPLSTCEEAEHAVRKQNNSIFSGTPIEVCLSETLLDHIVSKKKYFVQKKETPKQNATFTQNGTLTQVNIPGIIGIIVENLDPEANVHELIHLFSGFGKILNSKELMNNSYKNGVERVSFQDRQKNSCVIQYEELSECEDAIKACNNELFKDRIMYVRLAYQAKADYFNLMDVLVSGLDPNVNVQDVLKLFSPFGEVLNHGRLVKKWNFGKGFCHIHYRTMEECRQAIKACNNMNFQNKILVVKLNPIKVSAMTSLIAPSVVDASIYEIPTAKRHKSTPNVELNSNQSITSTPVSAPSIGIFVENLDPVVNVHELLHLFSGFGEILNSKELMSWDFGREHCIIKYRELRECEEAISVCNNELFKNRIIFVGFRLKNGIKQKDLIDICVSGVDPHINAQDLLQLFAPFGEILNHQEISQHWNVGKEICHINYRTKEESNRAVQAFNNLNVVHLTNKNLVVMLGKKFAISITGQKRNQTEQSKLSIT